jgi:hypothetical protein
MSFRQACRILSFSALAACIWSSAAAAQSVRVQLKVSADEPLKGSLQKLLTTELTALPQVLLADAEPDYIISVIALKVVTQSSKDVGVTFSVLVTAPYELKIREFAESHVAPEDRAKLSTLLSGVVKPLAHWVETASANQLAQVCRSIVQSFARDALREPPGSAALPAAPISARLPRANH